MSFISPFNYDHDLNTDALSSQQLTDDDSEDSNKQIWENLVNKSIEIVTQVNEYLSTKSGDNITPENADVAYLNQHIFPYLLPILEKTIYKAIRMECLTNQKSLFNGIDYICERLWIKNPKYPERLGGVQNIFLFEWVQALLKEHPRLIFPKSWIWSKEEATIIIQAYMRGHFVRKKAEVQEMRQFWKAFSTERKEKIEEQKFEEVYDLDVEEKQ